jgi:threonylcarbamoyladenosine tRNA methylthiotransferase MtaB
VVVIGCFAQLNSKIIENKKIGIILGTKHKTDLAKLISEYQSSKKISHVDIHSKKDVFELYNIEKYQNSTRAFIKIQDGCDFMCSYCVIPFVRGRQCSLSHKTIITTILRLVENDYKEIILTGVNTAGYKENNSYGFYELLKDINKLHGNFRVRISSLEPFQITNSVIELITKNPGR